MNGIRKIIMFLAAATLFVLPFVLPPLIHAGDFTSHPNYKPGEILVKLKKGTGFHQLKNTAQFKNLEIKTRFGTLSHLKGREYLLLKINDTEPNTETAIVESLSKLPEVESASLNYTRRLFAIPNDPLFERQWGLRNTGQIASVTSGIPGADIDAPAGWDINTGSPDVVIAVIDTGVDYLHEDLWENMWVNPGETPGNGIDDDGNGYIDDVYGYDFAADVFGNNDNNPMGVNSHGTHVAGIIAAKGNNGIGVAGVCWDAKIMAIKAFRPTTPNPLVYTSDEIEAFEYIITMKTQYNVNVAAINCSFGGLVEVDAERDVIEEAGNAGIIVVAAAGNGGDDEVGDNNDQTPEYPASYDLPNVISVAATDSSDELADFSNFGADSVDIAAPGTEIQSTSLTGKGDGIASLETEGKHFSGKGLEYAGYTDGITKILYHCGYGFTPADFPAAVYGNIALIERGDTTFAEKVTLAQNAGAAAAVIYNNAPGDFLGTLGEAGNWIPAVAISRENGLWLLGKTGGNGNPVVTLVNSPANYEFKEGTSMAAPMVSGAAGLLAARYPLEVMNSRIIRLLLGGDPLPSLRDKIRTGARLNIGALKIQPPLGLRIERVLNRSLFQTEYINTLFWQANPQNQAYNISGYRIYRISGKALEFIAEVDPGQLNYRHRRTGEEPSYTYAVVAVDAGGTNGEPALASIK